MADGRQHRIGWTVARLLREGFAHLSFRRSVLNDPLLGLTIADLLADSEGLAGFLTRCEGIPGCGDAQINSIRAALETEIRVQSQLATAEGDPARAEQLLASLETPYAGPERHQVQLSGQFLIDPDALMEEVCLRLWQQAPAERFHYMPASLPEWAKTPAVIAAERGTPQTGDLRPETGLARCAAEEGQGARFNGLILVDRHALGAIRQRCGRYAGLSQRDLAEQMAGLSAFCAKLPLGIEALVTDFERARLHASAIVGQRIVLPGPGGYAVFTSPPGLSQMVARCEAARTNGEPLAEHLAALG